MDKKTVSGATRKFDINPCPSENNGLLHTHRDDQARTASPEGHGVPAIPTITAWVRLRNIIGKPGCGYLCIPDTKQILEGLLGGAVKPRWHESSPCQWDCKGQDEANMSGRDTLTETKERRVPPKQES